MLPSHFCHLLIYLSLVLVIIKKPGALKLIKTKRNIFKKMYTFRSIHYVQHGLDLASDKIRSSLYSREVFLLLYHCARKALEMRDKQSTV